MRIDIIAVGELDQPSLRQAADAYAHRLARYATVRHRRVRGEPLPARADPGSREWQRVQKVEAERLLRLLPPDAYAVALDRGGRALSSEDVASWLNQRAVTGDSRVAFLIGGPLGLDGTVLNRCQERWSLSRLTFPHQLVPVILLEQLYRGFRILRGEPYHY